MIFDSILNVIIKIGIGVVTVGFIVYILKKLWDEVKPNKKKEVE